MKPFWDLLGLSPGTRGALLGSTWGLLWGSWANLRGSWDSLGNLLRLGSDLGPSWNRLGVALSSSWAPHEALLGPPGALLGPLGAHSGRSFWHLGHSYWHLGTIFNNIGCLKPPIVEMLKLSTPPTRNYNFHAHAGAEIGPSWTEFDPNSPKLGPSWAQGDILR